MRYERDLGSEKASRSVELREGAMTYNPIKLGLTNGVDEYRRTIIRVKRWLDPEIQVCSCNVNEMMRVPAAS